MDDLERWVERLFPRLGLGAPVASPRPLSGGFLHRMYAVDTSAGRYALKLLNPHIMRRPQARGNFRAAEALEALLEARSLPILPALTLGGRKMQALEGQFCYVFPWYPGKALSPDAITPAHCRAMGAALAAIHQVQPGNQPVLPEPPRVDWQAYPARLAGEDLPELAAALESALPLLEESQARGEAALARLPRVSAICHNDMDSKNVLWREGEFRIIDLECLSHGQPHLEAFETALCWAGYAHGPLSPERFRAFLSAYLQAGGTLPPCPEALYWANCGRLGWLEYNLNRALGSEGEAARALGRRESLSTLEQVARYAAERETILSLLGEVAAENPVRT